MIGRRVHADGAGSATPGGRETISEPNPDSHLAILAGQGTSSLQCGEQEENLPLTS